MADIVAVARRVLHLKKITSTMKMQKLVFYAQAHALATRGKPLFDDDFQAWVNGPVAPTLFREHRGKFMIREDELPTVEKQLTTEEQTVVDSVVSELGSLTGNQLSKRTHGEDPWKMARGNTPAGMACDAVISQASMAEFYAEHPIL